MLLVVRQLRPTPTPNCGPATALPRSDTDVTERNEITLVSPTEEQTGEVLLPFHRRRDDVVEQGATDGKARFGWSTARGCFIFDLRFGRWGGLLRMIIGSGAVP